MSQQFDCVILGGGIVGAVMALALANHDFSVALVETKAVPTKFNLADFDTRVSAITRASETIFKNLNVWNKIKDQRTCPYKIMRVWEEKGDGFIEFTASKIAEPNLGHIIENKIILNALYEAIAKLDNINLFTERKCEDFYHQDDKIHIQLDGQQELIAKLFIGADGAQSWLRTRAEFILEEKSYNHHAIVATIKTELPHENIARQRFLCNGILAFLPLSESHTQSIVWSIDSDKAKQLLDMPELEFNQKLQQAFANTLGTTELISQRYCFPLFLRHVKDYAKPRIALIGDAAHTIHPLAGQGVNLGLLDAAALTDILTEARDKGRDFGLLQHLKRYQRARKGENQRMLLAMSGFKQLFSKESTAIVKARSLGLNLTNKAEPVKNLFIRKALGLSGDLPSLARKY